MKCEPVHVGVRSARIYVLMCACARCVGATKYFFFIKKNILKNIY